MAHQFKYRRMVEFSETDTAGIVHFANYFRYMEMAEHAFFRSLGFSIHPNQSDERIGWPRVRAECEYKLPLRFEDWIEVHLRVREKRRKSLSYEFIIFKIKSQGDGEEHAPLEVARGQITTVCIVFDPQNRLMKASPIPQTLADKIEVAP